MGFMLVSIFHVNLKNLFTAGNNNKLTKNLFTAGNNNKLTANTQLPFGMELTESRPNYKGRLMTNTSLTSNNTAQLRSYNNLTNYCKLSGDIFCKADCGIV